MKSYLSLHRTPLLLLTALVALAYLPTLPHAFISDDLPTILNNPDIHSFSLVVADITFITRAFLLWLITTLFDTTPAAFRGLNILFHLGVTLLAYELCTALVNKRVGLITAALIAVHPLMIESVTWISGGIYAQYTFFLLLSLLLYRQQRMKTALLVYLLALTTSEKAAVFPLLLFVYSYASQHKTLTQTLHATWRRLIPFVGLATVFAGLKILQFTQRATDIAAAAGETLRHNPLQQIPVALSSYLRLIVWPDRLTIYHTEFTLTTAQYLGHLAVFLLLIVVVVWAWRTEKRPLFFGMSLFVIALLPTLTPFGIAWVVAERYVYAGAIGVFFAGAWLLDHTIHNKTILWIVFSLVVTALLVRTTIRNADWQTRDTFWIATAAASPTSPNAFNNLGDVYVRKGNLSEAHAAFMKAIELRPTYADAYHNLGNVLQHTGNTEKALTAFDQALQYKPHLWQSHQNRASILFTMGRYDEALAAIDAALSYTAQPVLYTNKGVVLLKMGRTEEGIAVLQHALTLNPQDQKARALLNEALAE